MLLGMISKLYKTQGINTIKAITTGNKTVQQNDINWSKRILGKEALAHININIICFSTFFLKKISSRSY